MGLFDKIASTAKKVTDTVGATVNQIGEAVTEKPSNTVTTNEETKKQGSYIPNFVDMTTTIPQNNISDDLSNEIVEKVVGVEREFTLKGKVLKIPANMDAFNSYRNMFNKLAQKYAKRAVAEYNAKISDYITFVEVYPTIYDNNLYPMIKRAIDILISENVWSVTFESLTLAFKENFANAIRYYSILQQATEQRIAASQEFNTGLFSFAADLIGSKTGMGDSSLFDGLKEGGTQVVAGSTGITVSEQKEIFECVNIEDVYLMFYVDYLSVCMALVALLNKNGQNIWLSDSEKTEEASNIFKNLSNPNFPQDKLVEVLFDILDTNPYEESYQKFLISKFGKTDEVKTIVEYFGYSELLD